MDNKVSLEAMLHLAAVELDEMEYHEYKELQRKNELEQPSDEFTQKMQKVLNKEKKSDNFLHFKKGLSRVAVVVLVSFSFLSMSFLSVGAVRKSVADVILEWYDGFTRIFMINEEEVTIGDVEFGYIPAGFEMVDIDDEIINMKQYKFEHKNEHYFYVQLFLSEKSYNINMDNDRLNYHSIVIDEISGLWTENNGYNQMIISINGITYNIAGHITLTEIIKIYENINLM